MTKNRRPRWVGSSDWQGAFGSVVPPAALLSGFVADPRANPASVLRWVTGGMGVLILVFTVISTALLYRHPEWARPRRGSTRVISSRATMWWTGTVALFGSIMVISGIAKGRVAWSAIEPVWFASFVIALLASSVLTTFRPREHSDA